MSIKRFVSLISLFILGIFPISSLLADNIYNDIDATIDATVEQLNLTTGGSANVTYKINFTNGDGENGCNLNNGESVTFSVASSNGSAVTTSTPSITFNGPNCQGTQVITVNAVATGSSTITLIQGANNTGGTYNLATATFAVTVTPAVPTDVTAPVITPTITPAPNGNGWNNSDTTVMWTVVDPESSFTTSGCGTSIVTTETTGTTFTCSATSAGGSSTNSVTIKLDKTKPIISGSATPPNGAGWNNTSVDVDFTCAESGAVQSGIVTDTVAGETLSTEGAGQSVTNSGTCTDAAGNSADAATVSGINIDTIAPEITGTPDRAANVHGWYKDDVAVTFTCADAGSGIATDTVSDDNMTLSEGAEQSVTSDGDCIDVAGNVATTPVTVGDINIDKTAPVVVITTPAQGGQYLKNSSVLADWSTTDTLSGIDNTVATAPDGSPIATGVTGTFGFTVSAIDKAGNSTEVTNTYSVFTYVFSSDSWKAPVTIASKDFKKTSTIPVKFQLFNSITGQPVGDSTVIATLKVNGVNANASGGSNVGNFFRFDSSAQQFIYNLSTKSLNVGSNQLQITITNPSVPTTNWTISIR